MASRKIMCNCQQLPYTGVKRGREGRRARAGKKDRAFLRLFPRVSCLPTPSRLFLQRTAVPIFRDRQVTLSITKISIQTGSRSLLRRRILGGSSGNLPLPRTWARRLVFMQLCGKLEELVHFTSHQRPLTFGCHPERSSMNYQCCLI